ncbi:hypothetical protein STCU_09948 [Strigomonas culicis]|uniref:Uncharacterized protein n=1 Tax=Strigomonas culicis TaxID=28005 RepID=S9TJZ0_9TRYP|nr:hypothetical protein STCU_09948 [Strigomonas culicis]|eukprot:EPY18477.1 hypothetical protein STCU_09948 [Strigomonas culicis]
MVHPVDLGFEGENNSGGSLNVHSHPPPQTASRHHRRYADAQPGRTIYAVLTQKKQPAARRTPHSSDTRRRTSQPKLENRLENDPNAGCLLHACEDHPPQHGHPRRILNEDPGEGQEEQLSGTLLDWTDEHQRAYMCYAEGRPSPCVPDKLVADALPPLLLSAPYADPTTVQAVGSTDRSRTARRRWASQVHFILPDVYDP